MKNFFRHHWQYRVEKFYRRNKWHLISEILLILIVLMLAAALVVFHLYRPKLAEINNTASRHLVDLNNPPLVISFDISEPKINLKDEVVLKMSLKNNSSLVINDLKINLLIADKNYAIADNERLFKILPISGGEKRDESLTVRFVNQTPEVKVINWQAQTEYSFSGQAFKEVVSLPTLQVNSDLSVQTVAYYHSPQGDQLGSGPLPPVVDIPTNYWIFWTLASTGEFNDFVFSAQLPRGVELTNNRSLLAGDFNYNSKNRQIIWKIKNIKANSDNYRVGFEVQLIPTKEQLGKKVVLISNQKYFALDAFTKKEINQEINNLTSNLDFDRLNSGQGMVSD